MIVDELENAAQYYALGTSIEKALRYLQDTDFSQVTPGRYDIEAMQFMTQV